MCRLIRRSLFSFSFLLVASAAQAQLQNQFFLNNINDDFVAGDLNQISTENSLIISDPAVLALLEQEYSFGKMLGDLAYHQKVRKMGPDPAHNVSDSPSFIWRALIASDRETSENTRRMDANRAGDYTDVPIIPYSRRWKKIDHRGIQFSAFRSTAIGINQHTDITPYRNVMRLWPSVGQADQGVRLTGTREQRYNSQHVWDAPFRLLAVINRMDMSGNLPRGSGPFGFTMPRAFGEVHFIYGLIDREYEAQTGTPYPHTMQLTYRLAPLNAQYLAERQRWSGVNGTSTHGSYMLASGLNGWRERNQRWARLWAQLSRIDRVNERQKFANHLHAVLARTVNPGNFLNWNSNAKVGGYFRTSTGKIYGGENEFRAYYANQGNKTLFPIPMEREAHRCMMDTGFLRNAINSYMVTYPADGDYFQTPVKDLMVYNPNFITNLSNNSGRNAYMLGNNTDNHESDVSHPALNGRVNGYFSANDLPGCSQADHGGTPYSIQETAGSRVTITPRISRTNWRFAWRFPERAGLPQVSEEGRHSFAIRSCSGCHGKETRTDGFHIFNRLDNTNAGLSRFLSARGVKTLKIVGNVRYEYKTINHRKDWLYRSSEKIDSLKPGYGLIRKSDRRL